MADELVPLIEEVKRGNALTTELLKEKRADDTPSQIFKSAIPEVFAEYDANKLIIKSDTKLNETDFTDRFLQAIGITLSDQYKASTRFYAEMFNYLGQITRENTNFQVNALSKTQEGQTVAMSALGEYFLETMKPIRKVQKNLLDGISSEIGSPVKDLKEVLEEANKKDELKVEEEKKEKKVENKNFLSTIGGFFTEPLSGLKESFDGLTDGLLGKAGITTLIVLAITGLLAFFKPAADLFAAGITAFAGTFSGAASFLRDPTGDNFFKFLSDEFLGISMTLALALTVFRNIIKKISVVFFKLIAIPMLIFNVVEGIVDRVMNAFEQDYNVGGIIGAFFDGLIIGFFDGLKNVLNLLFDLLLPDDIAASFKNAISGFFDGITSFFTEGNFLARAGNFIGKLLGAEDTKGVDGMYMDGPVAAGSPYLVGERGPELFVPGAAGGIIPNGMGGAPIIVNNNQVNQSSNTANHQHSNVSITDSQQEITGL